MNKFTRISIAFLISFALCWIIYHSLLRTDLVNKNVKVELVLTTDHPSDIDIFIQEDTIYNPEQRLSKSFGVEVTKQKVQFNLPKLINPGKLRIDAGTSRGKWEIHEIKLVGINYSVSFSPDSIYKHFFPVKHIKDYTLKEDAVTFETTGPDPILETDFYLSKYMQQLSKRDFLDGRSFFFSLLLGFFIFYFLNKRLASLQFTQITNEKVLTFLFVLVVFLPFIKSTFFPAAKKKKNKYEESAEAPTFNIENVIGYTKQYSKYFNQSFGFREDLIFLNSYYKYKIFRTSSKPDLVAIGKHKWLYFVNHSNWGDYQNINLFTEEELKRIKYNLEELHTWNKNRGIQFYLTIVPNKSNIYPENLPWFIKMKHKTSRIEQLRDYLKKNSYVHIVDVVPVLLRDKPGTELYYPNDTHWNTQAGFRATQIILDTMRRSFPNLPVPNMEDYKNCKINIGDPDLAKHLGLERILQNFEWMPIQKDTTSDHKIVDSRIYISQYILMPTVTTEVKNDSLPKIVVYRDSFFGLLQPYFSESFRRCVYVWSTDITKEVIDTERPNIVLFEMIEGRIYKLLDDNPEEIKNSMNPQ